VGGVLVCSTHENDKVELALHGNSWTLRSAQPYSHAARMNEESGVKEIDLRFRYGTMKPLIGLFFDPISGFKAYC
jgi:hypothetical protein